MEVSGISQPLVTVCVSTRNRPHFLPRLVSHLEQQSLGVANFDAVIVDNGSTDDTWAVLQQLAATSPVTILPIQNPPGQGPAAGRNRAWRAARAPLCAFTDDDCMPTPTWLEAAVAALGDRAVIAAGRVSPPWADTLKRGLYSRVVAVGEQTAAWGATANLIVRRADLETVGGFDEVAFMRVAGEDTDLVWRVLSTGASFAYLDDALVHHGIENVGVRGLLRDHQRWIDVPLVMARNPKARRSLLQHGLFWKPSHPRVLLLVLGLAMSRRAPASLLLALPWLHRQLCSEPYNVDTMERLVNLPALLLLDLSEVSVMVRGSARHKALVL